MLLFNITNHKLSTEQIGEHTVINMPDDIAAIWSQVGNSKTEVRDACSTIYNWIRETMTLPGYPKLLNIEIEIAVQGHPGATYMLVTDLQSDIFFRNAQVVYAASKRESVEITQPDGSVRKVAVFKHLGWVEY